MAATLLVSATDLVRSFGDAGGYWKLSAVSVGDAVAAAAAVAAAVETAFALLLLFDLFSLVNDGEDPLENAPGPNNRDLPLVDEAIAFGFEEADVDEVVTKPDVDGVSISATGPSLSELAEVVVARAFALPALLLFLVFKYALLLDPPFPLLSLLKELVRNPNRLGCG